MLPQQPFHSTSLPLDARVPEKIKAKIWNEEFVNLGAIVSNPDPNTRYEINFRPSEIDQSASLVLEPTAKSKRIKSISDWLRAFHIFVAVYTKKYPYMSPWVARAHVALGETFSTAVEWIAREKLSIDKLLHLHDDFLTIASTYSVCKAHVECSFSFVAFWAFP